MTSGLEVEALSCAAGDRLLFAPLGFALRPGQWLRLGGPNGSGKSTLLRALAGLVRPVQGRVTWDGTERVSGDAGWHRVMLYQGHAAGWKDSLEVLDNLKLQLQLDSPGPQSGGLAALLARVGLGAQKGLAFGRLSAGQRRRLSLARLSASRHRLWLLDEPTTALDNLGQSLFGGILNEHLGRGGCALIATHLPIDGAPAARHLDLGDAP